MIFLKFTFLHTFPFVSFKLRALIYLQEQFREKLIPSPVLSTLLIDICIFVPKLIFTLFFYKHILTIFDNI